MVYSDNGRFRRLVGAEIFKLRRRPMFKIMLAIQTGLCAIIPLLMYLIVALSGSKDDLSKSMQDLANDRLSFPGAFASTVASSLSWGLPILIVLTACACGGEFAWGTIRLLLSRGEGRGEYCLTKFSALFICWLVIMATGVISALGAGFLVTWLYGGNGISAIGSSDVFEFVGRIFAGMLGGATYIAMTALVATITRSTSFAVALGLVAFFADRLGGNIALLFELRPIELIVRSTPAFNVGSLTGDTGDTSNPVSLSIIVLTMYTTAFLIGTIRTLRRADIQVAGVG